MSKELSSHLFSDMYKKMGIDVKELGCIMLDTEPLDVADLVPDGKQDLYTSKDPKKPWIKGDVANDTAHVTLLYGLMKPGKEWSDHVDEVLDGWKIGSVRIDRVDTFDNHYPDEDYICVVGHVKVTPELQEGHERLQFLPHIDTFPGYKAHITLAYIKNDGKIRNKWVNELNDALAGKTLKVKPGVNYGGFDA